MGKFCLLYVLRISLYRFLGVVSFLFNTLSYIMSCMKYFPRLYNNRQQSKVLQIFLIGPESCNRITLPDFSSFFFFFPGISPDSNTKSSSILLILVEDLALWSKSPGSGSKSGSSSESGESSKTSLPFIKLPKSDGSSDR